MKNLKKIAKIKNVNSSYKNFKKEINLYQEYLVNIEYKEHEKKGILANNDDSIYAKIKIKKSFINTKINNIQIKDTIKEENKENNNSKNNI